MKRHAKASSAGSTQRQASRLGRIFREADATRGSVGGAGGSGAPSPRSARFAIGLILIAITGLTLAPSASAFLLRLKAPLSFGPAGSGDGQLSGNTGIAVDQGSHAVYVADTDNHRIVKFDSSGNFVSTWGWGVSDGTAAAQVCTTGCQAGTSGSGPGQFASPRFIAVDNSAGPSAHAVYVGDSATGIVQKFTASGSLVTSWGGSPAGGQQDGSDVAKGPFAPLGGVAVGPAGVLTVYNSGNSKFFQFTESGTATTSFPGVRGSSPRGIGVDPAGNLFKVDDYPVVEKIKPGGADIGQVDLVGEATDLTIDPVNGDLYTVTPSKAYHYHFNSSGEVVQPDASTCPPRNFEGCRETDSFAAGDIGGGAGIAIDHASDTVYISDPSSSGNKIVTYGPVQSVADATGTPTAATSIGFQTATIGATIDDNNSLPTRWRLEYSGNGGVSWTSAETGTTAGNESGVAVSATLFGLAVNTQYQFRVVTNKGLNPATEVDSSSLSFQTLNPPAATAVPASPTNITDSSVDLGATITDNSALPTSWRLELSSDGGLNWSAVQSGTTNGGESGVVVSKNVTGLIANTDYEFRVVTNKGPGSGEVASNVLSFHTPAVPPLVSDVGAVEVTDNSARLVGTIDPKNSPTEYVFEYGSTPALGTSTDPLSIGSGTVPLVVSLPVSGLSKDTTYYVRVTATNALGSDSSSVETFHTRALPLPLPDGRAYEQVSPVDKNFGDAVPGTPVDLPKTESVGLDGEAIVYGSVNSFGEPPGQVLRFMAQYQSERRPGGWHTETVFPPTCANDQADQQSFFFWIEKAAAVSANADHAVIPQRESASCATPPLSPAAPLPATNLYKANFTDDATTYDLLAPNPGAPNPFNKGIANPTGMFVGGSNDFSHVFYRSKAVQAVGAPAGDFEKLYEWDNGTLRLASVDPSGNPFTTDSEVAMPLRPPVEKSYATDWSDAVNATSANGDRFFFLNPTFGSEVEIYMRQGGTTTSKISESECTTECGESAEAQFEWADVDGDKALVATSEKLLDADTPASPNNPTLRRDLYFYKHSPNPTAESNLTMITVDSEPADGTESEYRFGTVLGTADDGETVFFTAEGQLVAGGPTEAGEKIYRWTWNGGSPTLEYLATAEQDKQSNLELGHMERRVNQQGNALMVETSARIDPVADSDSDIDVYLWRLGHGWSCASCQSPGTPSAGPSTTSRTGTTKSSISFVERQVARKLGSAISVDGERVFFLTPDSLVAGDTNGPCPFDTSVGYFPCNDVYEWHDGQVSLITPGNESSDVGMIGAGESGDDVFFYTRQRLVGWDGDNNIDVYDARVGGGFPEPPAQPAGCEGEACRGQGSSSPGSAGAGTAVFQGPGNPTPKHAKPRKPRKHRKHSKHRRHSKQDSKRNAGNNRRTGR